MHEHEAVRQQRLAYEKILYRYSSALQSGDLDTIIDILHTAESDPHLEQMIFETHKEGYQQEESSMSQDNMAHLLTPSLDKTVSTRRAPKHPSSRTGIQSPRPYRFSGFQNAVAVLIVAILVASMLFLFRSHHKTNVGSSQLPGANGVIKQQQGDIIVTASVIGEAQAGTVTAINTQTGATLWHYKIDMNVNSNGNIGLVIQDHIVYIAYNKQALAFQARDGKLLWKTILGKVKPFDIGGDNPPQLIVDQHEVYASGYSGSNLYTLDTKTGKILWHYDADVPPLLTVHNGTVYVLAHGDINQNAVKALNGTNGSIRWTYNTTLPLSATVANNVLYVQAFVYKWQQSLFALNPTNGELLWTKTVLTNGRSQLVVAQGVLVLFDGNHFCGYRTTDGNQVWCTKGPKNDVNGEALVSLDGIIYGAYHPSLLGSDLLEALNPKDGSMIWSKDLGKARIEETPIISLGNNLLLPCYEGVLVFNRANGRLLWQSSGYLLEVAAGN